MQITSPAFANGSEIPLKYGYHAENINPPLSLIGVPSTTKSLALIMDDPDVPPEVRSDRYWVHWVMYNIDPKISLIKENCGNLAPMGRNTAGEACYMGPAPPDKEHRYYFKLFALDCTLTLKPGVTKEALIHAMEGHIIDEAELMGRYKP